MKVNELIEHLKTFPQDLDVIYCCYSDYEPLNAVDIDVQNVSVRNGRFCTPYAEYQYGQETPVYKNAVVFPGN